MNSNSFRTTFATIAMMLVAVCFFQTRSAQSSSATTSQTVAKPLLLEKDEGERRIWREPPPGDFILKVSPKTMVLSTLSWALRICILEIDRKETVTVSTSHCLNVSGMGK